MDQDQYIEKRIQSKKRLIRSIQLTSNGILCFGGVLLIWAIANYFDGSSEDGYIFELSKLGISVLSFLSPIYTKGELINKHRERMIDLEFLKGKYPDGSDEAIMNKIIATL